MSGIPCTFSERLKEDRSLYTSKAEWISYYTEEKALTNGNVYSFGLCDERPVLEIGIPDDDFDGLTNQLQSDVYAISPEVYVTNSFCEEAECDFESELGHSYLVMQIPLDDLLNEKTASTTAEAVRFATKTVRKNNVVRDILRKS